MDGRGSEAKTMEGIRFRGRQGKPRDRKETKRGGEQRGGGEGTVSAKGKQRAGGGAGTMRKLVVDKRWRRLGNQQVEDSNDKKLRMFLIG